MFNLTPELKISSCKYKLFKEFPFYAYLADSLKFQQNNKVQTMGVSPKGELFYNPTFVDNLPQKQVLGVIVHELMHVALMHIIRTGKKDQILWNIATDIVINAMLIENGFELPECGLIPKNNSIKIGNITINDLSKKSAEDVYNELVKNLENEKPNAEGFDYHGDWYDGNDDEGQGNDNKESQNNGNGKNLQIGKVRLNEDDIKKIIEAAAVFARMRGQASSDVERIISESRKPKINWRAILRNEVASCVKSNFTWSKPNKKYTWSGMYLPTLIGESVQVLIHIDTSASISKDDLGMFLSEIIGLSRSYEGIQFRILAGDTEMHDDIEITPSNYQKIKNIKLHGGGGTSHVYVFEYIKKYKASYKTLICFTDGYTEWPISSDVKTIIVLCPEGTTNGIPQWAKVIKMN